MSITTNCSIETLTKENFCHVVVNEVYPSIEVITGETFCNVNHTIEPLSNKLVKSDKFVESSNMNQFILVGGIPRKSCDSASSVNKRVRATQVAIANCNTEDGRDMI